MIYRRPRDFERFERILRINQYFNLFRSPGDSSSGENRWEETVALPQGCLAGGKSHLDRSLLCSSCKEGLLCSGMFYFCLTSVRCQAGKDWRASGCLCSGVHGRRGSPLGGVELAPPRIESSGPGERGLKTFFPFQGHTAGVWGPLHRATG